MDSLLKILFFLVIIVGCMVFYLNDNDGKKDKLTPILIAILLGIVGLATWFIVGG